MNTDSGNLIVYFCTRDYACIYWIAQNPFNERALLACISHIAYYRCLSCLPYCYQYLCSIFEANNKRFLLLILYNSCLRNELEIFGSERCIRYVVRFLISEIIDVKLTSHLRQMNNNNTLFLGSSQAVWQHFTSKFAIIYPPSQE